MNSCSSQTPWDRLLQSYLKIDERGHEFPLPSSHLPPEDSRVLDLGCGVGTHLRTFRTLTNDAFGVDLSSGMVQAAIRVAPVAQANCLALPFADDSFDYLWSGVVISCVPDWRRAFDEALRVVRPGGKLVILVANRWSIITPFRTILSLAGRYSEGFIMHLSRNDFVNHRGPYGHRVVSTIAIQKEGRSSNPLFRLGAKLFYSIDKLLAHVAPSWGGDLCLIIERLG